MQNLFTRNEAAEYLGVSASAVKVYITQNRLPAFKKGKTWLFQEEDLKTFKESEWFQTRKPGAPRKYSDDTPRLHLFVNETRRKKTRQKKDG